MAGRGLAGSWFAASWQRWKRGEREKGQGGSGNGSGHVRERVREQAPSWSRWRPFYFIFVTRKEKKERGCDKKKKVR